MISYKRNFKKDIFIVLLFLVGLICSSQAIADSLSKLMTQNESNIYYIASDVAIGKIEGGDGNVSVQEKDIKLAEIKAKLFTGEFPNNTAEYFYFKHKIADVYSILGMIGVCTYECEVGICTYCLDSIAIFGDKMRISAYTGFGKAVYKVLVFYQ